MLDERVGIVDGIPSSHTLWRGPNHHDRMATVVVMIMDRDDGTAVDTQCRSTTCEQASRRPQGERERERERERDVIHCRDQDGVLASLGTYLADKRVGRV